MSKEKKPRVVKPALAPAGVAPNLQQRMNERVFKQRTRGSFDTHRNQAKKLTPPVELDYDADELRVLVREAIGKPCPWCQKTITVRNYSPDHRTPLWRGGTHTLANLRIVTEDCNRLKGEMTEEEFTWFLDRVQNNLPPEVVKDIFRRMKIGASFGFASDRAKAQTPTEEQPT